jgi:hypothetical protein
MHCIINIYYSFGMITPNRKFFAGTGYRYGFNGKESDTDLKGEGNQQDCKGIFKTKRRITS